MARRFNGTTSRLFNAGALNTATFTLMCWMKPFTLPGGANEYSVVGFEDGTSANDKILSVLSTGVVRAFAFDGSTRTCDSTRVVSAGKWSHIAMTGDNSTMRVYVDGTPGGTSVCVTSFTGYSGISFRIGGGLRGWAGAPDKYFDGAIRDVWVSSTPLGPATIKEVAAGLPISQIGALAGPWSYNLTRHWRLACPGMGSERSRISPTDYVQTLFGESVYDEVDPPPLRQTTAVIPYVFEEVVPTEGVIELPVFTTGWVN